MPAYLIVTANIHDMEPFRNEYGAAAGALTAKFGGKYLMMAGGAQLLEGDSWDNASMVISEWPDKAAALAFWNSDEYAEAKKLREGCADVQVLLIEAPSLSA
jgi:uncharacterized protein (DUF1330 family)